MGQRCIDHLAKQGQPAEPSRTRVVPTPLSALGVFSNEFHVPRLLKYTPLRLGSLWSRADMAKVVKQLYTNGFVVVVVDDLRLLESRATVAQWRAVAERLEPRQGSAVGPHYLCIDAVDAAMLDIMGGAGRGLAAALFGALGLLLPTEQMVAGPPALPGADAAAAHALGTLVSHMGTPFGATRRGNKTPGHDHQAIVANYIFPGCHKEFLLWKDGTERRMSGPLTHDRFEHLGVHGHLVQLGLPHTSGALLLFGPGTMHEVRTHEEWPCLGLQTYVWPRGPPTAAQVGLVTRTCEAVGDLRNKEWDKQVRFDLPHADRVSRLQSRHHFQTRAKALSCDWLQG